jgi:hypothetical protein
MTVYVFGTAIVTSGVAVNLRELSRRLDKGDCDGMFVTPLSATGLAPATHYISTGWVPQVYAQTLNDATLLYTRAKKAWEDDGDVFPFTQAQVTNALSKCDVSADPPFEALTRMGLQLVQPAQ